MNTSQIATGLNRLGWHVHTTAQLKAAAEDFQRGWNLGAPLLIDGDPGPRTQEALGLSLQRLEHHLGTASAHFSYAEFACKCGATRPGCRAVRLHRGLLSGLEEYRATLGHGIIIVSGYRCPGQNAAAGGATNSQHLYGAAADVDYALADVAVARLRRFSGIGRSHRTHLVRHMDVRHLSGNNTTGGTPDRPTIWDYAA